MREKTKILGLKFEEFKKLTLEKVRIDNYLNKVESWEENVLHSEFYENNDTTYYTSNIYFICERSGNDHYIKMYKYIYSSETFYEDGYEIIDNDVLSKIALLENLISKGKGPYLFSTLKKFQECAAKIK